MKERLLTDISEKVVEELGPIGTDLGKIEPDLSDTLKQACVDSITEAIELSPVEQSEQVKSALRHYLCDIMGNCTSKEHESGFHAVS